MGYLIGFGYLFVVIFGVGLLKKLLSFSVETSRKLIHILIAFTWLIIYHFFGNTLESLVLPICFIIINALSYKFKLFKMIEREDSSNHKGTIYYAIAITLLFIGTLIFEGTLPASGVAVFCLSFGDGAAALFGSLFKKNNPKLIGNKTLIGTICCFIFSIVGIYILGFFVPLGLAFWQVLLLSLATAILELVQNGFDNFSVSLGVYALSSVFMLCC